MKPGSTKLSPTTSGQDSEGGRGPRLTLSIHAQRGDSPVTPTVTSRSGSWWRPRDTVPGYLTDSHPRRPTRLCERSSNLLNGHFGSHIAPTLSALVRMAE